MRRSSAAVDGDDFGIGSVVDEEESVAAEPGCRRFDDGEYGARGNDGVDGMSAVPEHLCPCLCREWVGADDHSAVGDCRWSSNHPEIKPEGCGSVNVPVRRL